MRDIVFGIMYLGLWAIGTILTSAIAFAFGKWCYELLF